MPTLTYIFDFVRKLAEGTTSPLTRWLSFAGCIVLSVVVAIVLHLIFRHFLWKLVRKTKNSYDDEFVLALKSPLISILSISGIYASTFFLHLSPGIDFFCHKCYLLAVILLGLKLALRTTRIFGTAVVSQVDLSNATYGALLANLMRPLVKMILWIIAILLLMKNVFDINISAFLAGAGIAAMAIAFAAQNTIANIFGAVSLIADRPFRLGDRIQVGDKDGVVEAIGLRSTRLRALDGTIWNIPNRAMTDTPILNYAVRPNFKEVFKVMLTYNATAADLRRGKEILQTIFSCCPLCDMEKQPPLITFIELGDYSLNLQAVCWFQTTDFKEFLAAKEEINFKIVEEFAKAKLDIAFPTQTICLEKSDQ